ncbi:MAG: PDZ domain-containing protein [Deltaproteobacteria bacterium]|nr:PDZ domain-containing protein [Deltaproteobacteria bacterium]MBW2199536.1 PDZ domain-containing protein [Deltaproteobacteria bacterium]MBW2538796.1 PDZ domain-containing protein [Deltaproteobacteria bacterium]
MTFQTFRIQERGEKKTAILIFAITILCLVCTGCLGFSTKIVSDTTTFSPDQSVIRVNVTRQGYNFRRPWEQLTSKTHTAIGVIIAGPRVLVTASLIADHRYIELEKIDTGEKSRARLEKVDYEGNLALLKPERKTFLKGMQPVQVTVDAKQGDELQVWQVKPNGTVTPGTGTITAIEAALYSYRNYFLLYRLNGSLQYRFGNITMPVVKDGKLAGLVMRYDAKRQTINVLAAPVIKHFLADASDGKYMGFPTTDVKIVSTADPQLRQYANIPDSVGGVYVEGVAQQSAAAKAGLRKGDIIIEIAGYPIDRRGNFEHPIYGKMALSHLLRCEFHVGDKIKHRLYRAGKLLNIEIIADHRRPEAFLVPPYIIDIPPRYYILGGLVLQELSVPYLQTYGKRWSVKAPIHFVYYEKNQDFLENDGRKKIVFLSGVLPNSYTIGYESLSNIEVTRINNQVIARLEDVPRALETPVDGFHKIEFKQRPKMIYLNPMEIPKINEQIKKRYRISVLQNLN